MDACLNIVRLLVTAPFWMAFFTVWFQTLLLRTFVEIFFPEIICEITREGIRVLLRFFYNLAVGLDEKIIRFFLPSRPAITRENESKDRIERAEVQEVQERREDEDEGNFQGGNTPMAIALTEERLFGTDDNHNENHAGVEPNGNEAEVENRNHDERAATNVTGEARDDTPEPLRLNQAGHHNHLPTPDTPPFPYLTHRLPGFLLPQRTQSSTASNASASPTNFLHHRFFFHDPRARTNFEINNLFPARGPSPASSSSSSLSRGFQTFIQPRGILPRLHPNRSLAGRSGFQVQSNGCYRTSTPSGFDRKTKT